MGKMDSLGSGSKKKGCSFNGNRNNSLRFRRVWHQPTLSPEGTLQIRPALRRPFRAYTVLFVHPALKRRAVNTIPFQEIAIAGDK
jgi:hypothetical protein